MAYNIWFATDSFILFKQKANLLGFKSWETILACYVETLKLSMYHHKRFRIVMGGCSLKWKEHTNIEQVEFSNLVLLVIFYEIYLSNTNP